MMDRITSLQNPRVKAAVRLRDARGRREQQRIIIDGERDVARALDAELEILEVFVLPPGTHPAVDRLADKAASRGAVVHEANSAVLEKLSYGDRCDPILAIARPPHWTMDDLAKGESPVVGVLEQVEKPGNLGAIARSADAAGVTGLLVADGGTDLFNPNAIRASAGTLFQLPVVDTTGDTALDWLRRSGFRLIASRVDAPRVYWDVSLQGRVAFILGSEAEGLSDRWRGPDIEEVRVPQQGVADSLSVSVTAALLFYEAWRQRGKPT